MAIPLDLDIIHDIALYHLDKSPSTVASLSMTSRSLSDLLKYLKFRSLKLKLNTFNRHQWLEFEVDNEPVTDSSAERLATKLKEDPEIVNHVKYLWIGRDDMTAGSVLPRLEDLESVSATREREALCYILDRPWPVLTDLTLSAMRFPKRSWLSGSETSMAGLSKRRCVGVRESVWGAFNRACSSSGSLARLSLHTDTLPTGFLFELGHITSLNVSGRSDFDMSPLPVKYSSEMAKGHPHEIEIEDKSALGILYNPMYYGIDFNRLTVLSIKDLPLRHNGAITEVVNACSSTLTTLKLFYSHYHFLPDGSSGHDNLLLNNSCALKSLTLASSFPPAGSLARANFQMFTNAILSYIEGQQRTVPLGQLVGLESVTLVFCHENHYTGSNITLREWVYLIDSQLWKALDDMLSPEQNDDNWPGLKKIRIGLLAAEMSNSLVDLLQKSVKARLPNVVESGRLELLVEELKGHLWTHSLWCDP